MNGPPARATRDYLEGVEDGVVELNGALIGVLRGQIARLTRLTDDIHAVSAADEGRLDLKAQPVRVDALIRDATETRPAYAEQHVQLVVHAETSALIEADHDRPVQVLTNLLRNALRHTPRGERVGIRVEARRDAVDLVVQHTGEGIEAEHLPHVFERFYRAHPISGDTGGSGIGLTISRAIVAGHHGRITVHSAGIGQGTEVRITLPRRA
jgi:two-component system, OmpR family, sensor histidine kinase BaeS